MEIPDFTEEDIKKQLLFVNHAELFKAKIFVIIYPEDSEQRINEFNFDGTKDIILYLKDFSKIETAIRLFRESYGKQLETHRYKTVEIGKIQGHITCYTNLIKEIERVKKDDIPREWVFGFNF